MVYCEWAAFLEFQLHIGLAGKVRAILQITTRQFACWQMAQAYLANKYNEIIEKPNVMIEMDTFKSNIDTRWEFKRW